VCQTGSLTIIGVEEFEGYINLETGTNYIFEMCGNAVGNICTTNGVDDGAIMWLDQNNDGQLSDDERIMSAYGATGLSTAQSFTTGVPKRFRVRFKEVGSAADINITVKERVKPDRCRATTYTGRLYSRGTSRDVVQGR
jgi:hypothetical protein